MDKQEQIYQKYKELFVDNFTTIDVRDGWCPLVERFCEALREFNRKNPEKSDKIAQIKQKFAELRIYLEIGYWDGEPAKLVELAEKESAKTCEVCGAMNETVKVHGKYWLETLCENCKGEDKG